MQTRRVKKHLPHISWYNVEMDHDTNLELYKEEYFFMGAVGFIHDQTCRRGCFGD